MHAEQRGTMVATVVLLVVGTVVWVCGATRPDGSAKTVFVGLDHRLELLHTFQGYTTVVRFHGPARGDGPRATGVVDTSILDFGLTQFYLADLDKHRWLAEEREYYAADVAREAQRHTVMFFNEGLCGERGMDASRWSIHADVHRDCLAELLGHSLFLTTRVGERWSSLLGGRVPTSTVISSSVELVDGVRCYRLDVDRARFNARVHIVVWVDPGRGFAVCKWAFMVFLNGKLTEDHIGHAFDFREYPGGIWLPTRTKSVRSRHEGSKRIWHTMEICRLLDVKVNQPLDYRFPVANKPHPTAQELTYDARLRDGDVDELKRAKALQECLSKGPGAPETFMEDIPELPRKQ